MAMVNALVKKIGLLGSRGLLGSAILAEFGEENVALLDWRFFLSGAASEARQALTSAGVQMVINCAAHTNVEAAETDPETDRQSNAVLPLKLAVVCATMGLTLIHFSSTGCYGDWQHCPYVETDPCRPTTNHHEHKLAGEEAIRQAGCRHLILRTGWLFGRSDAGRPDFVSKRIDDAGKTSQMTSDASQFGNPTFTADVAKQTRRLIEATETGIFNVVNIGNASRLDYVREIVKISGLPCIVSPGPAFTRKAKVSCNEMARTSRLADLGLLVMGDWREALSRYMSAACRQSPPCI